MSKEYILCNDVKCEVDWQQKKIGIFVHLHYVDSIMYYWGYLRNVPDEIDIYISTSEKNTYCNLKQLIELENRANIVLFSKENRGRDISALLVTFREYILQYYYMCFFHDNKAKNSVLFEDTQLWIETLWDSMLSSEHYVRQIISLFDKENKVGVLMAPPPLGKYITKAYVVKWDYNYDNVKKLVDILGLNSAMDIEEPPISVGTVFWCRVKALDKLFQHKWKYEDFDDEPLPGDGTLSHAIERVFQYVAKDAGYESAIIMSDKQAVKRIRLMKELLIKSFETNYKYILTNSYWGIEKTELIEDKLVDFTAQNKKNYLYGAGQFGRACLIQMIQQGIMPDGFVVTDKTNDKYLGLPVYQITEIPDEEGIGFVVSVSQKYLEEIEQVLNKYEKAKYMIYRNW